MHIVLRILHANRLFVSGFLLFFAASLFYGGLYSKSTCFINLNGLHTSSLDHFFIYFTVLGDGWTVVLLFTGLLLFRRTLKAIRMLAAYFVSGVIAQLIKNLLPAPRPKVFFQPEIYANFIEGITRGGWASFPSGHTATAFAVATVLAFHARNKWYGLLYLVLAIAVGYSRIYLGQHFLEDVTAGAVIGAFFGGWICLLVKQVRFLRLTIEEEPMIIAPAMQ